MNDRSEFNSVKARGSNPPCPHTFHCLCNWKIALLFVLKGCHDDVKQNFIYFAFLSNQGLLDLDGRNSQKYLHQTKADF